MAMVVGELDVIRVVGDEVQVDPVLLLRYRLHLQAKRP